MSEFSRALIDTSIQIDRCKIPTRGETIESLLGDFNFRFTTSIGVLEFKATIIQECVTLHNMLCRSPFTQVRDEAVESMHRQHRLRAHILNNIIKVWPPVQRPLSQDEDAKLAEKAKFKLQNAAHVLFKWVREESVDSVLSGVDCTRATQPPGMDGRAMTANMPICKRGKNKRCNVEAFVRQNAPELLASLAADHDDDLLAASRKKLQDVIDDADIDVSHSDCRTMGDCLVLLEGHEHATHAVSTNERDWGPLSACKELEFVKPEYEKPKTTGPMRS